MATGNVSRDHLFPKVRQQRATYGSDFVAAHRRCNMARSGITIGSQRFNKWIRAIMRGVSPEEAGYLVRRRRWRKNALTVHSGYVK